MDLFCLVIWDSNLVNHETSVFSCSLVSIVKHAAFLPLNVIPCVIQQAPRFRPLLTFHNKIPSRTAQREPTAIISILDPQLIRGTLARASKAIQRCANSDLAADSPPIFYAAVPCLAPTSQLPHILITTTNRHLAASISLSSVVRWRL